MDPSEINSFEDQWRRALKDASETPPPSVWEGIEASLEKDDTRGFILPLWWQSPKMWYAAATIAALLLVGAGIWYSGRDINDSKIGNQIAIEKAAPSINEEESSVSDKEKSILNNKEKLAAKSDAQEREDIKSQPKIKDENTSVIASNAFENKILGTSKERSNKSSKRGNVAGESSDNNLIISKGSLIINENPANEKGSKELAFSQETNDAPSSQAVSQQRSISSELLSSLPYSDLDVHIQKRYVFFRPEIKSEEPVKTSSHKEYWAGIGLMPASFNPDVKVKEAPLAFSSKTLSNKKSVSGSSESGVSYAVQTQGGMRISKHWSVELGLSYLKGNSDYQGGGYVLSAYNSKSANVLENALAGLASAPAGASGDFLNNGAIYIDVSKKVSNNYQYLQLPVQAGFTINPDKRLSYSVLGGMMANFFISNDLESASGEIITTTASDEIYRSMNWAATTGLRFNYRLTSKWKASLTGSYQKAISSGFRSNQSLDAHPYLYGVAWGVRYSF